MGTSESENSEGIRQLLANLDKAVIRTGTIGPVGEISFLWTLLRWKELREFEILRANHGRTPAAHLLANRNIITDYFF